MDVEFKLSRLCITGPIDDNTPLDVLLEIAEAHNLDCSELSGDDGISLLIDTINEEDVPTVRKNLTMKDYEDIAIFVNISTEWNIGDLTTAFKFLKSFRKPSEFLELRSDFQYGSQTKKNLNSINNSVVYGACKYFNIRLFQDTSQQEMVDTLRRFLSDKTPIIDHISHKLKSYSIEDLLKIIGNLEKGKTQIVRRKIEVQRVNEESKVSETARSTNEPKVMRSIEPLEERYTGITDYEKLKSIAISLTTFHPTKSSISDYKPKTHLEAIVISQFYHDTDISKSGNPIHALIRNEVGTKTAFNPSFPINLYNNDRLNELLNADGYPNTDELEKSEKYELLQLISLSDTFYPGIVQPIKNTETPIELLEINSLRQSDCLSYGSSSANSYTVITYKELYNYILNNNNLMWFGEPLTDISIKKLLYLSKDRNKLKSLIERLYQKSTIQLEDVKDIIEEINDDSSGMAKDITEKFMNMLFELGINMRGWNGEIDRYPIEAGFQLEQGLIERRVSESLRDIDLYKLNFPLCDKILNLPLIKYRGGKYLQSNEDNGLTIKHRLDIVKKNKTTYACIRMTSNWILSSVYKYCLDFGVRNKFQIEMMRELL